MDKSLLRRSDRLAVGAHYGILETIRGYGLERLEASGEAEIIRRRHASYYRALVEALAPRVKRPELVGGLDRLALELGNLRAAVTWAVAHDEATTTVSLAAAIYPSFWFSRGDPGEGRGWLEAGRCFAWR